MKQKQISILVSVLFTFMLLPSGQAEVLLREDFKNLDQWEIHDYKTVGKGQKSSWRVSEGKLWNTSEIRNTDEDRKANQGVEFGTNVVTKRSFTNATFRCVIQEADWQIIYGLIFRYTDENNYYRLDFNCDVSNLIVMKDGKVKKIPLPDNFCYVLATLPTTVDLACNDDKFSVYINGYKRLSFHDKTFSSGRFGFFGVQEKGTSDEIGRFSDVYVFSDSAPKVDVRLAVSKTPYLYWCTGSEVPVAWETNIPGEKSIVEYGLDCKFDKWVEAKTNVLIHQAVLSGIEAGKKYEYRCYTDGILMGTGDIRSDPGLGKPAVFGLLGDSQHSPQKLSKLNSLIMSHQPDFILHVGDTVNNGILSNWDHEVFKPNAFVMSVTPYFVSMGNHEWNSKYFSYYLPYPDTNNKRGHYYATRYGCVAFIVFDDYHVDEEQLKWFEETLASPMFQQADWKIVMSHEAPYCVGWVGYSGSPWKRGENFMGLLKKYHVDFLFNGHTHSYERGMIDDVCTFISGGVSDPDLFARVWDHVDVFSLDRHYGLFKVTPKRAEITFTNIDGKQIDRLVLEKGKSYYLDATPTMVKHPEAKVSGKLNYVVNTLSLGSKLLKYKISYNPAIDTYQWTEPAAASSSVQLTIEPKPGKYRVRIVGMDEDGRVTRSVIHEVEVVK